MAALQAAAASRQLMTDHSNAPMFEHHQQQAGSIPNDYKAAADDSSSSFSWLTFLGFLFLTFNSAMAIVRSQGDITAIAFVIVSYSVLVALFVCLRMYERAPAGSAKREWLKVAVWILTTLLTFAFSWKVAAVMPAPVAALVWLMAFATAAGGFVAFFVYREKKCDHSSGRGAAW